MIRRAESEIFGFGSGKKWLVAHDLFMPGEGKPVF